MLFTTAALSDTYRSFGNCLQAASPHQIISCLSVTPIMANRGANAVFALRSACYLRHSPKPEKPFPSLRGVIRNEIIQGHRKYFQARLAERSHQAAEVCTTLFKLRSITRGGDAVRATAGVGFPLSRARRAATMIDLTAVEYLGC